MSQSKKGNQSGRKGGCNQVSQTIFICRKYGCNHHQKLRPESIVRFKVHEQVRVQSYDCLIHEL